jgi:hypothetical protein
VPERVLQIDNLSVLDKPWDVEGDRLTAPMVCYPDVETLIARCGSES